MESVQTQLAKVNCAELTKLQKHYPNFNFDQEVAERPELADFLKIAVQKAAMVLVDPLTLPDAPKMNDDFSNYFVINNLPKCKEDKLPKLLTLIEASLKKKNLKVNPGDIDIPINPATQETDGVAFVKLSNEENARLGVSIFDGFKLTKNNIFAACLLPEFDKVMQTTEQFEMPQAAAEFKDLRAPVFDIRHEQYFYKHGNAFAIDYFQAGQNPALDHTLLQMSKASDKPMVWSPQGTYLIMIKPDKVIFLGGKEMTPIIVLPKHKVISVKMSPCERYVLTYSPMGDTCFTVWNFQMVEVIREFVAEEGDDHESYQWSYDGQYIARRFRTEQETEGKLKVKEGLSVYNLPSMQLLANKEGQKKSITVEGITDWAWAPHRNLIVYTAFFPSEDEKNKLDPKIGFMKIPERRVIDQKLMKGSEKLTLVMHPQGNYLGVVNQYKTKKAKQFQIEVFDLNGPTDLVPHQQIFIKREVYEFTGLIWEPMHNRIAVHTLAKRELEAGKKDYTVDAKRHGIDIYEMQQNKQTGFEIKLVGFHPSEKVTQFSWSPAGDIFVICEKESLSKNIWSFFMIVQSENVQDNQAQVDKNVKGKKGTVNVLHTGNIMGAVDVKYEFRKTARHEISDARSETTWDPLGRYLCIYGVKPPGPFDKTKRSIRIFSMLGELLHEIEKLSELQTFQWRPRPSQILSKKELIQLKKDCRTKYGKVYKEDQHKDTQKQQGETRERKGAVIDDFLEKFFLPQRAKYEADLDWYKKHWPLKPQDMEEKPATINHLYAYGDQVSVRRVDL